MQGALFAAGVVDAVLQLHDATGAVGGHQRGAGFFDQGGFFGADLLAGIIVIH